MNEILESAYAKVKNIRKANKSIYDIIENEDHEFWINNSELIALLNNEIVGVSFFGLALRTRSKRMKELICNSLGYKTPKTFKKVQPRFLGQNFDIYTQKSNNLQIWNEEIDPDRRYIIIKLDNEDTIVKVILLNGVELALLDKTGTLTQKYQARLIKRDESCELISSTDTENLSSLIGDDIDLSMASPISNPVENELLSINSIFDKLKSLIGIKFKDLGSVQERNRGGELHKIVCEKLGFKKFLDNGQFPDIKNQLLEVKLQTSPTIDLGLVTPNSVTNLNIQSINNVKIRHCDVRYALFCAEIIEGEVILTNLFLTTGQDFFNRFPRFEGKVLNTKIQIPLPSKLFDTPPSEPSNRPKLFTSSSPDLFSDLTDIV